MFKDQCISVTELRTQTKKCVQNSKKNPQYIFNNNKPVAVLINIDEYEANFMKPELIELEQGQVNNDMLKKAQYAKKKNTSELLNI